MAAVCGAVLAGVLAQPAECAAEEVVRLEVLERLARERGDLVASEQAAMALADAQLEAVEAGYRPDISLGAESALVPGTNVIQVLDSRGRRYRIRAARAFGDDGAFELAVRYSGTLRMDGVLYDFGRTASGVRAARLERDAARADALADRRDVVLAVRAAYVDWYAADLRYRLALRGYREAVGQREQVEENVEIGARPESDVTVARYAEAAAELRRVEAADALMFARAELEALVGQRLPSDARPDPELTQRGVALRPEEDPRLEALLKRQAAAFAEAERQRRSRAPALGYSLEVGAQGQGDTVFPAGTAQVRFGVPLWSGGRDLSEARAARARARATTVQVERLRESLQRTARQVHVRLQQARERERLAETACDIAREALRQEVERYQMDGGSLHPVIDARGRVLEAEARRIEVSTQVALAALGLTH